MKYDFGIALNCELELRLMCRWLAYSGSPVVISTIVTRPDHSLIDQSRRARQNIVTTNGDGFGVGWYGEQRNAACYRDIQPAWNDANLRHLAAHIRSPLFLAHVRAASGTAVQRTNCHPFAFENWLFQHNGSVPEFRKVKRRLLLDVDPDLFPHIEGSTDSELLFYLALTFGLQAEPQAALERMVGHVERVCREVAAKSAFTFSAAACDGWRLFAVRYSSDNGSPTLYHSRHVHALRAVDGSYEVLPDDAIVVLSEPLDELTEHWKAVPESSFVTVEDGEAVILPFTPVSE